MKPLEFIVGNYKITYRLNWIGIETVLLNGKKISKKLSLGKRVHTFELLVDGTMQSFHLESKQSFSGSHVKVELFQNGELIATDYVTFFESTTNIQTSPKDEDNSMFYIGLVFVVLSLCFDWSKVFLFIGLIFLFSAANNKTSEATPADKNHPKPKH